MKLKSKIKKEVKKKEKVICQLCGNSGVIFSMTSCPNCEEGRNMNNLLEKELKLKRKKRK